MRLLGWAVSLSCFALATAAFGVGCLGSAEGQPCSVLGNDNGDSECKDGLVCTPQDQLNGGYTKDACCPQDRSQATTLVCMMPTNPARDAGPPGEGDGATDSASETSTTEAGASEASTVVDSAAEAAESTDAKTDAKGDASSEGG